MRRPASGSCLSGPSAKRSLYPDPSVPYIPRVLPVRLKIRIKDRFPFSVTRRIPVPTDESPNLTTKNAKIEPEKHIWRIDSRHNRRKASKNGPTSRI
jgi:hypothetical protein